MYEKFYDIYVDGSVAPLQVVNVEMLEVWHRNSGNPIRTAGIGRLRNGKIGVVMAVYDGARYFISKEFLEELPEDAFFDYAGFAGDLVKLLETYQ